MMLLKGLFLMGTRCLGLRKPAVRVFRDGGSWKGAGEESGGPSPVMAPKVQLLSWNKELVQLPSAYGT